MPTYTIDTAAAMERLENGGLDHGQAKAIVECLRDQQAEVMGKEQLKSEIQSLKNWMLGRMLAMQGGTVAILFTLLKLFPG